MTETGVIELEVVLWLRRGNFNETPMSIKSNPLKTSLTRERRVLI